MTTIGKRLFDARMRLGITRSEVAATLGLPTFDIEHIESSLRKVSTYELQMLADLYGRPVAAFLDEPETPAPFPMEGRFADEFENLSAEDRAEVLLFAEFLRFKARAKGTP